nr:MAG TPA: hypothetical protein [Caudoviricetes sp.]
MNGLQTQTVYLQRINNSVRVYGDIQLSSL